MSAQPATLSGPASPPSRLRSRFMPQNVYHIDAAGKFYLVAVPTSVGAVLRLPYA